MLGKIFEPKRKKVKGQFKKCRRRIFMICAPRQILFGSSNQGI
jgi:hypothetical protein